MPSTGVDIFFDIGLSRSLYIYHALSRPIGKILTLYPPQVNIYYKIQVSSDLQSKWFSFIHTDKTNIPFHFAIEYKKKE